MVFENKSLLILDQVHQNDHKSEYDFLSSFFFMKTPILVTFQVTLIEYPGLPPKEKKSEEKGFRTYILSYSSWE